MKKRFSRLSRQKQIAAVVFAGHFFLVFCLLIHHGWVSWKYSKRPIVVHTISPPVESKSAPIVKAPLPQKKVPPVKPTPKKPEKPAKATVEKPQTKKLDHAPALKEATAALAELKTMEKKVLSSSFPSIPAKIDLATKDKRAGIQAQYKEHLVSYLEAHLDLPEVGEVTIQLQIDREGRLIKSELIASENHKNSEFLKKRLPELTFPCFNDFNIEENVLTFTISFRNAEIP